jgi:hypothetical protein
MVLNRQAKRWLAICLAVLTFAYVWSAGGYWHYVVAILVGVSAVAIFAEVLGKRKQD